jgi:hypothetical protein
MNHITILVALALGMFLSSILVNTAIAYAQQVSSSQPHSSSPLPRPSASPLTPKLHTVRITSPIKGQQVPTGKDLTVYGVTTAGTAVSHCQVSVIANGVKPYQPAMGTGPGGQTDYSKWNFILTSKYTTINPGLTNKITAKHTCKGNPNLVSFSSVNVIGVGAASTATKTAAVQPQPIQQQNITRTTNSSTTGKNNANTTQPETSVTEANNTAIAINKTNTAASTSTSTTLGSGKLIYLGATKLPGEPANTKSTTIVHHHQHSSGGKSATTIVHHHHHHHNTGSHDRGKSIGGDSGIDFGLNSDSFPF